MSLEIRELKITGYINKSQSNPANGTSAAHLSKKEIEKLTKKIKAECIEAVMEKLERRNRR